VTLRVISRTTRSRILHQRARVLPAGRSPHDRPRSFARKLSSAVGAGARRPSKRAIPEVHGRAVIPSIRNGAGTSAVTPFRECAPERIKRSAARANIGAPRPTLRTSRRDEQTQERHDHDGKYPMVLRGPHRRTRKGRTASSQSCRADAQCGRQRGALGKPAEIPIR